MECILCNEQYVGKTETSFNITLYNHQEDVKNVDAVMGCKPFHLKSLCCKRIQKTTSESQETKKI